MPEVSDEGRRIGAGSTTGAEGETSLGLAPVTVNRSVEMGMAVWPCDRAVEGPASRHFAATEIQVSDACRAEHPHRVAAVVRRDRTVAEDRVIPPRSSMMPPANAE
jgi:hypothetical protein